MPDIAQTPKLKKGPKLAQISGEDLSGGGESAVGEVI
jgi:hypothetical protein